MNNIILELITKKKITQDEIAKILGLTSSAVSQMKSGKINITVDNIIKISKQLHIPIAELFGESDMKENSIIYIKYINEISNLNNTNLSNYDYLGASDKLLKLLNINDPLNLLISKVSEKNMEPAISINDFVLIDLTKKEPFNNRIYIIQERNTIKIKRMLMKSPIETTITIVSDNEIDGEYPAYSLPIESIKEMILGQVIFYGRSFL